MQLYCPFYLRYLTHTKMQTVLQKEAIQMDFTFAHLAVKKEHIRQ